MWSLSTIRDINEEAARKAAQEKKLPYVPTLDEVERWLAASKTPKLPFPFLGDYLPKGWQYAEFEGEDNYYTVDTFGGGGGGFVMSIGAFLLAIQSNLRAGHDYGYAIRDQYQFCVDVFIYERKEAESTKVP